MDLTHRCLFVLLLAAAGALGACSTLHGQAGARQSNADLVAAIRAAGHQDDSVIHVAPLRSPQVTALIQEARAEERAGQYQAAAHTLDHALGLAPDAPDLLQDRAELAVRLGNYQQAEKLARRSWTVGPRLGSLCARNWQTVLEMRRIADDPAGVKVARKHLAACEEKGPVRL